MRRNDPDDEARSRAHALLDRALAPGAIRAVFQPIVRLRGTWPSAPAGASSAWWGDGGSRAASWDESSEVVLHQATLGPPRRISRSTSSSVMGFWKNTVQACRTRPMPHAAITQIGQK